MANSTASVNTTSMYNTPQAVDDFYSVMEADTLGILKFDVMSNDLGGNAKSLYSVTDQTDSGAVIYNTSDLISKDTASWTGTAGGWEPTGQGGSIRINNGKLEYLVSSGLQARIDSLGVGETITDRVTYTIQLGNGTLSIAEATISFSGTNDAPVISIVGSDSAAASFNETNGGLSKTGTLTVTDADTTDQVSSTVTGVTTNGPTGGLSNDALKAMLTLSPGTLEANSDAHNNLEWNFNSGNQAFNFLAVGETLTLTYAIQVSDGHTGGTDTKNITVTIHGTNDAPVLTGTAATLAHGTEDTGYTITATSLLAGFTDVDSSTLSVSGLSANHGALVDNHDGTWTFTPAANYNGPVDLSYNVVDGHGGSTAATQSFVLDAVNDAPVLAGTAATLAHGTEDTGYTIAATDLLAGFTDVDGDTLSVSGLSANHGTLVDNLNGTWTFTPAANYNGPVDLSYNVVDGHGGSTAATQSFVLDAVNDAPVLAGTAATLAHGTEDTGYTITATDLLAGFTDVDGDTLSVSGLSANHGTLVDNLDGTWTFTPTANYNGPVDLSYNVVDGHGGSTAATQSFVLDAVNDAPVLTGTAATLAHGTEDTGYTIAATDLLTGFTDVDGDTLSVSGLSANHGTLVDNLNGTWTFTPTANYNGPVDLSYNVVDGHGGSTAATQSFVLDAVNDAPVLTGTAATLAHGTEDTGYTIAATDLLAGFTDVDGDTLSVSGLSANHGTLVDNLNGTWTFTPAANYNGPVDLSYNVVDGHGGSTAATQSFVLDAIADAAVIGGVDAGSVTEDAALTTAQGQLTLSDPDGPTSFVATSQSGTYGNFSMGSDGLWTYSLLNGDPDTNALNDNDHKTETFAVQSADGTSHNVVITVNGHSDFTYVAPTVFTGTGDPNDNDNAVVSGANSQTGTSASETFTGSANNDKIAGGAGDDTINAGDGNDNQLYGQAGNDIINGGIGADNIYGGSGNDYLYGYQAPAASSSVQDGADDIYGGSGSDQIFGQNSGDVIVGGFGADTLTGGTGADTFRYLDVRDTGDTITDFSQAQSDRIDLTALYTGSVNGSVLIFDDVLATAGAVAEGHVGYAYDAGANVTTVYVGVNAAYGADLEIKLNGNIDLAADDFLL